MDTDPDYRPADRRTFREAVQSVDARDLRPTPGDTNANGVPDRQESGSSGFVDRAYPTNHVGSVSDVRPANDRDGDGVPDHRQRSTGMLADKDRDGVPDRKERVRHVRESRPVGHRPFSIAAGFFGWAVASFFTLVLTTVVLGMIGAGAYQATDGATEAITDATLGDLTTTGLVGLLIAVFIAYLLGGYAAGRIGLWHGTGHGLAVVGWSILFALLAIAAGAYLGDAFNVPQLVNVDWNALTTPAILGIVLTLAAMLAGALLGGNLGTRTGTADDPAVGRTYRTRGRPL